MEISFFRKNERAKFSEAKKPKCQIRIIEIWLFGKNEKAKVTKAKKPINQNAESALSTFCYSFSFCLPESTNKHRAVTALLMLRFLDNNKTRSD